MVVTVLAVLLLAGCASGQQPNPGHYINTPLPLCSLQGNKNGFVSLPNNGCQLFVFCTEAGTAYGPLVCPTGTLLDSEKQFCDIASEVQCNDGTPKCENRPVRGECEKFIECDGDANEVNKTCNEGTVYSMKERVCMRFSRLDEEEQEYCRPV